MREWRTAASELRRVERAESLFSTQRGGAREAPAESSRIRDQAAHQLRLSGGVDPQWARKTVRVRQPPDEGLVEKMRNHRIELTSRDPEVL